MVGAILTQNTAWSNVERAVANLRNNDCLEAESLLAAPLPQLTQWLRPSGYFNIKATRLRNFCQWYLDQGSHEQLCRMDTVPLRDNLLSVNGIGPETADDIVLYAFQRPVFVIDAFTRRLFSRLALIEGHESYEALRHWVEGQLGATAVNVQLFNQYHALIVVHAKEACRKRPSCGGCVLAAGCRFAHRPH
jgi:endonuclease III related protein